MRSCAVFAQIQSLEADREPFDIVEAPLWDGEGAAYSRRYTRAPMMIRLQTPVFVSAAIAPSPTRRAAERLERMALRKASLVAAISRSTGALVSGHYGVDPAKIREAPLGIEMPELDRPRMQGDSHKLLYVGRLEQRKGTQELIDALPRILGENQKITVDIVGRDTGQAPGYGSYQAYFEHTVSSGLRNRVHFHGFVPSEKLQRFYEDCDVFIAPSRYESFGLIYLEAMAYGKPVIGTRAGGIPEVVTDEVGRLVEPEDRDQIADAVLALMKDSALRRTLGSNAFRRVRQHFSVEAMVKNTLALYREAIALHQRAQRQ
jgi:glycosyltransferase involved in cell wall biosynthesis